MDSYLTVRRGTSRGRETAGYNIVSLVDTSTGKRYRAMGGGYDMLGTVLGEWLQAAYQDRLAAIADRAYQTWPVPHVGGVWEYTTNESPERLYGMSAYQHDGRIVLDGACGIQSMERIAEAVGLSVHWVTNRQRHVVAFKITDTRPEASE
jgi:hypothetical protein